MDMVETGESRVDPWEEEGVLRFLGHELEWKRMPGGGRPMFEDV